MYIYAICIVIILDGNSEIGVHFTKNHWYLICLRHLITNRILFTMKRPIFFHVCTTCSELPSNISTMILQLDSPFFQFWFRCILNVTLNTCMSFTHSEMYRILWSKNCRFSTLPAVFLYIFCFLVCLFPYLSIASRLWPVCPSYAWFYDTRRLLARL